LHVARHEVEKRLQARRRGTGSIEGYDLCQGPVSELISWKWYSVGEGGNTKQTLPQGPARAILPACAIW
ncbi:MAG TPA: hypothetical protein VNR51_06085, partial [Hyphomicrobium sp.]|nr:hypothetical protein [Hyphomicrobium sp.]